MAKSEIVGSAVFKISLDSSSAEAGIKNFTKQATQTLGQTAKESDKSAKLFDKVWDVATKGVKASLVNAFSGVTDAIMSFPKTILNVGATFESSMAKVSAISGATGEDLNKLTDKARELGANTKYSASEVGDGFTYMAMAGWKTEDMLAGMEPILNLATASGTDLATTSDIVTDALTAFGLKAEDTGHFADVLAAASSNSNTNVEMMGETFKYVAPIAGSLGYSIEDTSVAIGLMANAGIKWSQAGTSLRSIMTRLATPTRDMKDAMNKWGMSLTDASGKMRPFDEIMGDLRKNFADMTEEEKATYAEMFAGQEAMSGLLSIVNASPDDFEKLTGAVNDSNGATQRMSDIMGDTTEGKIKELQSKLEELAIKGFDKLKPAIDKIIEVLGWAVDNFDKLVPAIIAVGVTLATVKFITFAQKLSSTLGSAFKTAKNFTGKLSGVFKKDIGTTVSEEAGKSVEKVGTSMSEKISNLGSTISTVFKTLGDILSSAVTAVMEPIKAVFRGVGEALAGFFTALADPMIAVGAAMFAVAAASIAAAILLIGAAIGLTMPTWQALFDNIIMPTAAFIRDTVLMLIDNLTQNLIKLTNEALIPLGDFIVQSFLDIINQITDVITRLSREAIEPLIRTLSDSFMGILKTVSDFLNDTLKTAFDGIKGVIEVIGEAFEKMGGAIRSALDGVNGILGTFKDLILGIADTVIAVVSLTTHQSVVYGRGFAKVTRAATGGLVNGIGTATSDSNLFALSKGEYVIKASSAKQIGYENLDYLNKNGTLASQAGGTEINNTYQINIDGTFATSPAERRKVAEQIVEALEQNNRRRFTTA